jgi:asparagine synthase (glutamine-hydrolysing)
MVFDGRVDNRDDVRTSLAAAGIRQPSANDAELVLDAYCVWGETCPEKLIGDFAFAVWDPRSQQMFCARDPFGMRPFYYHHSAWGFIFASEMQPLFADARVPRESNLSAIAMFLGNSFFHPMHTLYAQVNRLPAAHSLRVSKAGLQRRRYFQVDRAHEVRYQTDDQYFEAFLEIFQEAVRCRIRSTNKVGIFLSGGMDSSSIACTAHMLQRKAPENPGLETFSIVFDEMPCDERRYINPLISRWNMNANFTVYERDCDPFLNMHCVQLPDVLYSPSTSMNVPALSEMRAKGIRVLLDGVGGDELLASGFGHLTDLAAGGHLLTLARQLRSDAIIYGVPMRRLFSQHCIAPFVPRVIKNVLRPLRRGLRHRPPPQLVRPEFLKQYLPTADLSEFASTERFATRSQQDIHDSLVAGWNAVVASEFIELTTSRFSLQRARPFFDLRVLEFLIGVPEDLRWRGDEPKFVLRRAMRGIVPEAVLRRRIKTEFSAPIDRELRTRQADAVRILFEDSLLAKMGAVNQRELSKTYDEYRRGSRRYLTGTIETLVGLELWCRSW